MGSLQREAGKVSLQDWKNRGQRWDGSMVQKFLSVPCSRIHGLAEEVMGIGGGGAAVGLWQG